MACCQGIMNSLRVRFKTTDRIWKAEWPPYILSFAWFAQCTRYETKNIKILVEGETSEI